MLLKDFGNEPDPGTWVPFRFDETEREKGAQFAKENRDWSPEEFPLSTLVRVRTLTMDEKLRVRKLGAKPSPIKMSVGRKQKGATAEVPSDPDADAARSLEFARLALTGISTVIGIETESAAQAWSGLLGRKVPIGQLRLDGSEPEAARMLLLKRVPKLVEHVVNVSDNLEGATFELEQEELGN